MIYRNGVMIPAEVETCRGLVSSHDLIHALREGPRRRQQSIDRVGYALCLGMAALFLLQVVLV